MNIKQCLKILELEKAGSIEDAKKAYRDLVRVWHPDRFQGNPRLKQKAEQKLREINLAYNYLRSCLETTRAPETASIEDASSNSLSGIKQANPVARQASQDAHTTTNAVMGNRGINSGSSMGYARKSTARTTSFGRFVRIAFFLIAVAIAALVVYLITSTDNITSKARGVASEAMENILHKLEQDGSIPKDNSSAHGFSRDKKRSDWMAEYELHLDSGSIILTDMWWEEGEMIMYRVDGGTMGIERSRVKKIIKR